MVLILLAAAAQQLFGKDVPALPDPDPADVVNVSTAAELDTAVNNAQEGQTILIADGTYDLSGYGGWALQVVTSNLTLRGASDDPTKVTLLGQGFESNSGELIVLLNGASGITIAYLTVRDVGTNAIKIQNGNSNNVLVHNVYFIDICERGIKGPNVPASSNWEVRYCLFEQIKDLTEAINPTAGGNYIGGMDVATAEGWHIHDNVFKNIRGEEGGGRGAIYLKQTSTNIVVERNTFLGCDRSICFGNPSEGPVDVIDSIIRNNFIYACASNAIELDHSARIKIYNNSMHQMDYVVNPNTILIYRGDAYDPEDLDFRNNIIFSTMSELSDPDYADDASRNLWYTDNALASTFFVDHTNGDFHLKATATAAIDQGEVLTDVTDDWDLESRGGVAPDMGADEKDPGATATQPPTCSTSADKTQILQGESVDFSATASDPDGGTIQSYEWDFDYDGTTFTQDGTGQTASNTFSSAGNFTVALRVTDDESETAIATVQIVVEADTDLDGMPDSWENDNGLNAGSDDSGLDPDDDGLTNLEEYHAGTDPQDPDTDGDGIPDGDDLDPTHAPAPFGGGCGGGTSVAVTLWLVLAIAGRRTRPSGLR